MIRKYHNHKLQTTPWHCKEEPLNHHKTPGRQIKQSNQLSLPHQDDCNISNEQQNIEQLQTPTIGVTITKSQQQQNHRSSRYPAIAPTFKKRSLMTIQNRVRRSLFYYTNECCRIIAPSSRSLS